MGAAVILKRCKCALKNGRKTGLGSAPWMDVWYCAGGALETVSHPLYVLIVPAKLIALIQAASAT